MFLAQRVEELEWVYEKLNNFLLAEENLGEFSIVDKAEPVVVQLRITIDAIKKAIVKEEK